MAGHVAVAIAGYADGGDNGNGGDHDHVNVDVRVNGDEVDGYGSK